MYPPWGGPRYRRASDSTRRPPSTNRIIVMFVGLIVVMGLTFFPWPTTSAIVLLRMPLLSLLALLIAWWGTAGSSSNHQL